jgi:hypothetical protein
MVMGCVGGRTVLAWIPWCINAYSSVRNNVNSKNQILSMPWILHIQKITSFSDDHIEQAIDVIRQWTVGGEVRPLEQLERIHYRINDRGLTYCHFQ